MKKLSPQCVQCNILRCLSKDKDQKAPLSCPTEKYPDLIKESIEKMKLPENQAINNAWLELLHKVFDPEKPRNVFSWTRVDEIMEYARIRGMTKLGIAMCYALMTEARYLSDIFKDNGFDVISVSCLSGEVHPADIGLPGDRLCNPIMQAEVLNQEKTELNVMVGLCLGHDIMFLRHCKAETTPLVVKDRALGHNPVAALYLSRGFYKDRFIKE